jgi:hypothetical protein
VAKGQRIEAGIIAAPDYHAGDQSKNLFSIYTARSPTGPKSFWGARSKAIDMFTVICGAALVAVTSASFWYFLPHNGQVHPLVEKFDGGSMITLALMTILTIGVVMMFAGFLG